MITQEKSKNWMNSKFYKLFLFRPFFIDLEFDVFDIKKVDDINNLITLDMSVKMTWLDDRISCLNKVDLQKF